MKNAMMLSVLVAVVAMGTGCSATAPGAALDASNAVRSSRVVEFTAPTAAEQPPMVAGEYEMSFGGADEAREEAAPATVTTGVSLRQSFASTTGRLSIVDAPVAPLSF